MVKYFTSKINNFLYNQEENDNLNLTFFRILIGILAFMDILSIKPNIESFFSSKNTIIPQELLYLYSDYYNFLKPIYLFLKNNNLTDFFYSYIIYFYTCVLLLFIIGYKSRIVSIMALLLQLVIFKSFNSFNYGFDNFLTMSFFYSILFPVNFLNKDNSSFNGLLLKRFLQIHLCIVYFTSAIAKSFDDGWWNGNAIYKSISSIFSTSISFPPILFSIIGISVLFLEFFYPVIFFKKIRYYVLLSIILMHIGIAWLLNLYSFATIMIIWNITAFYKFNSYK